MTRTAILAACLVLSGCASLPGLTAGAPAQAFLQHLELCTRTYRGAIGAGLGGSFNGSFDIACPAVTPEQAVALKGAN